jgi:2,4-dienoyl-CoA reductase-like NADH-dependent reductase (Old Yellow Enzyme family)
VIPKLFTPLIIRGKEFKNRIWVSPMCQYSAENGVVGTWHLVHLGAFATGGVGHVMVEATGVTPEGRISIGCPGIWNDEQADAFKPIIDFVHQQRALIGIQLSHAGRKGSTMKPWDDHEIATADEGGWKTVGASPIPYKDFPIPHELSIDEIGELEASFVAAAKRSVSAGFDVIEIHAAHGYLFHQFLSPLTNIREDNYGGTLENRMRFLLETAELVRKAIPVDTPLFVRISATDWVDGGWNLEESIILCHKLKALGVDLIDVSTGGLVHDAKIPSGPGYQVPFSAEIRRQVEVLTTSVGLITEGKQAEEILEKGEADAVMIARQMMRNPRWAIAIAEEFGEKIDWSVQLERARRVGPRKSPQ